MRSYLGVAADAFEFMQYLLASLGTVARYAMTTEDYMRQRLLLSEQDDPFHRIPLALLLVLDYNCVLFDASESKYYDSAGIEGLLRQGLRSHMGKGALGGSEASLPPCRQYDPRRDPLAAAVGLDANQTPSLWGVDAAELAARYGEREWPPDHVLSFEAIRSVFCGDMLEFAHHCMVCWHALKLLLHPKSSNPFGAVGIAYSEMLSGRDAAHLTSAMLVALRSIVTYRGSEYPYALDFLKVAERIEYGQSVTSPGDRVSLH